MKKIVFLFLCALAMSPVFCGKASAAGEHTHDGFFLRLAPGVGFAKSTEQVGSNKFELSGASGLFNFGIGGAIADNLILHLDASGVSTKNPTYKLNGREMTTTGDTTASTTLVGVGLTYYFPSNVYLTGSVGVAESKIEANGTEYKSDSGYGVNLMLGKEWWVSDNWGLGIAGQFLYTNVPDKDILGATNSDIKSTAIGILFSATFN